MARFAVFISVVALLCIGVLGYANNDADTWDDIDLSKLTRQDNLDPGFDLDYTRRPIIGGNDGRDNYHGGLDDLVDIPADATALLNCTTIKELHRHHHHSCGPAFGYATHHCRCDWGKCRESKRPHSWCGCPWGKCSQDRPKYCAFIWKYCEHRHHHHDDDGHQHKPGIEPRALSPVFGELSDDIITAPPAPKTTAPPAPKTTAPPATTAPPSPKTTAPPAPKTTTAPTTATPASQSTTAPPAPKTTTPPATTAPPATTTSPAPKTTAPPAPTTHHPTHRPSYRCGPWGYTTFACMCPMGSCYSRHRPHGYCGCPWGYCKNKRPDFCKYFWKYCPQPHCDISEVPEPLPVTNEPEDTVTDIIPSETYSPTQLPTVQPTTVNCGKYGVPSEKCKCSWHKCRFWPHRPSDACGCPWGYCREDRPKECKAETPNPHDLKPTSTPNKCGDFGVATKDCQCDPGNCRADRPSSECGCPWGQCDQRRPYHCKWRGTEDHHHHHHHGPPPPGPGHHHHHHGPPPPGPGHHHHHHGPPPHHHHHHHHHSGSSESRSSESRSSESRSSESRSSESWESQEDNHSGKDRPDREDNDVSDRLEMVLNGAMGFLLCSLGFLLIITIYSLIMKRVRAGPGPSYRNLAAAPVEFVRNPTEYVVKKPEDKEGLIQ